jgi:serine/threonine protein kinase
MNVTGNSKPSIPEYTLLRVIGRGTYGEVWLAQGAAGAYRAVKFVSRDQFDNVVQYEREFDALCRLAECVRDMPELVRIHHVGRRDEEGFYYYVMELADSLVETQTFNPDTYVPATLAAVLKRDGPLEANTSLECAIRLAKCLVILHLEGLIHRDVKPSNVLMMEGQAKLGDIGLLVQELPGSGRLGTEGYTPREGSGQVGGDIYALGKILYEMLSGEDRSQFPVIPGSILKSERWQEIVEINEIAIRAAAPVLANRYPTAQELLGDLESVRAQRPTSIEKKRKWNRLASRGFVLGLVATLAYGVWWFSQPAPDAGETELQEWPPPLGDFDRQEQNSPEFRTAFLGYYEQHRDEWRKNNIAPRPADATGNQLDLTAFYNADLLTTPHAARNLNEALNNNLKQLPQGIQEFNGIRFDIRGLIVLNSLNIKISPPGDKTVPAEVVGIPVRQTGSKIHFLHFCAWSTSDDTPMANYRVHYQSGKTETIPIRDQVEIQDWWYKAFKLLRNNKTGATRRVHVEENIPAPSATRLAWRGSNDYVEPSLDRIRVYHFEWSNPHPDEEISHLDLESTMTPAAATILAITIEP